MRWRLSTAALTTLVAVGGCSEPPSFRVRWQIRPRPAIEGTIPEPAPLRSSQQCSETGITDIQMTTTDSVLGLIVDRRDFPCFPAAFRDPDATLAGPAIPDGAYEIVARGLRRNGEPWLDTTSETTRDRVIDRRDIEIFGDLVIIDDFVFDAPPECDDGIDNDADGLVDVFDPSCALGPNGTEDVAITTSQFRVNFSFFSGNPNVSCKNVDVGSFRITIDDVEVMEPAICEPVGSPRFLASNFPAGDHVVAFTAVSFAGEVLTVAKQFPIQVPESGGFFSFDVDFADSDFLEPIQSGINVSIGYEPFVGALARECAADNSLLVVDQVRVEVVGAHGAALPTPVLTREGSPLDFSERPCENGVLRTETLTWGEYRLRADALSPTGEVCFTTGGDTIPLTPSPNSSVVLPRVIPPPASCIDCVTSDDCALEQSCDPDGICR